MSAFSALSVDVSYEMAAVNKELEALLERCEKTFDQKLSGQVRSGPKGEDRTKRSTKQKARTLSPEQSRLLSMERPPLDKLKEVPLEYLKPRPPQQIKEKLSHLQKVISSMSNLYFINLSLDLHKFELGDIITFPKSVLQNDLMYCLIL